MELQYLLEEDADNDPILMIEHARVVQLANTRRHRKELELTYGPEEFNINTQMQTTLFAQRLKQFDFLPGIVYPLLQELLVENEMIDPVAHVIQYLMKMVHSSVMHIEMDNIEKTCADMAIRFLLQQECYKSYTNTWEMFMSNKNGLVRFHIAMFLELIQSTELHEIQI